ncbi:hypothetical protein BC938DRAFT_480659 [Jimgerdemannia flammicorona]|uniref:W2 domain-containing protein n=1 Tax=Jimgerdemannia flammicorona TaxID=994334 RepID=A0A433QHZ1_9FUNG|nr:hypothetical protein BC938DRAFT_480659 [Jimgerdemannia flammicorona]
MSSTQTSNNSKPALHGVKIKQRKGVQRAQAKFEPEIFRDNFLKPLTEAEAGDYDQISANLDAAGNTLDYRKYGEPLFEILITGGILEPGGTIADDAERSPFSIFSAEETSASISKHVDVFNKLIRRYRYLQKAFEETLKNILQYINKWSPQDNAKLAMATGYFVTLQLAQLNCLTVLFKDYLVKDGHALQFVTIVFKTIQSEQNIEYLGRSLINAGIDTKLLDFFPPNKRDEECFSRHFEAEDMKALVDYHAKNQRRGRRDLLITKLTSMMSSEASVGEVITYAKQQMKDSALPEQDVAIFVWDSMMDSVDLINTRPDQVETQTLRQVNQWSKALAAFTTSPKTEITLLQRVQIFCYEDAKLIKFFCQIVKLLYKLDVLSENAILYWADKGAKPQGKAVFMKQMEPFVKWLKENEEEEDDDEEEED